MKHIFQLLSTIPLLLLTTTPLLTPLLTITLADLSSTQISFTKYSNVSISDYCSNKIQPLTRFGQSPPIPPQFCSQEYSASFLLQIISLISITTFMILKTGHSLQKLNINQQVILVPLVLSVVLQSIVLVILVLIAQQLQVYFYIGFYALILSIIVGLTTIGTNICCF